MLSFGANDCIFRRIHSTHYIRQSQIAANSFQHYLHMWIIVGSVSAQWSSGEYQSEGFSLEIVTPPVLPCLLQPELVQPWQPVAEQKPLGC